MMRMPPSRLTPICGRNASTIASTTEPMTVTEMGRSSSVRSLAIAWPTRLARISAKPARKAPTMGGNARASAVMPAGANLREAGAEGADDGRQRARERDDAGSRDRAGADIKHERRANLAGAHVANQLGGAEHRLGHGAAEQLDRRHEDDVCQAAAREQITGDPRPDDVAHAEQLGTHLDPHLRGDRS